MQSHWFFQKIYVRVTNHSLEIWSLTIGAFEMEKLEFSVFN